MFEFNILPQIIFFFFTFWTTGKVCLKSPQKMTTFPPKSIFVSMISRKDKSKVSTSFLFSIDTSSYTINFASRIKDASELCLLMLQLQFSFTSIESLKRERAVRPPGSTEAATPEVAVAKAISPLDRTVASEARYK